MDINGTAVGNRTAILMARMIRCDGAPVRPSDVTAIEYTIHELDACPPNCFSPVEGHHGVDLCVAEVIFDSLQTGGDWKLDDAGYNFRHAIGVKIGRNGGFPRAGVDYEVAYRITPTIGPKTIVRFHLRGICDER